MIASRSSLAIGLAITVGVLFSNLSTAQTLQVDYGTDALSLAQTITGNGVQLINPILTCPDSANGTYATSGIAGFPEGPGVILATGDVADLRGPNLSESTTTEWDSPGDDLLTIISGQSSHDACALEFDVVPIGDSLNFKFSFASEEYSEYVGTPFNDVFGFFIKGPGIIGDPALDDYENIAIVTGTSDAVGINTVNNGNPDIAFPPVNPQFYHDNPLGFSNIIQYDGWTVDLVAKRAVTPCDTFHLKLVVADVGDREWDSAVLIEEIESSQTSLSLLTVGGIDNLIEGCNDGTVTFTRAPITDQDLVVNYYLQGTAINGTDYPLIGGNPDPDMPKSITILANEASATIDFFPYDDGTAEGDESVEIYLGNPECSATVQDSLIFNIQDELHLTINPPLAYVCLGDSLTFDVDAQGDNFVWSPADFLNNPNIEEPTTTPTGNITYTLTSTVAGCSAEATVEIQVSDVQLSADITHINCGGANDGAIDLTASGGQSPYDFAWIGPNGFSADTEDISGLAPGNYAVLVTDREGCIATESFEITEIPALVIDLTSPEFPGGENISCAAGNDGQITAMLTGGTPPFDFLWDDPTAQTTQTATGLTAGTYTVTITDDNDCITQESITLTEPESVTGQLENKVDVLCTGDETGAAVVSGAGGNAPYDFEWNTIPPQFGPAATGLEAGTYTVTVTDINNCSGTIIIEIEEPSDALAGSIATVNPACFGDLTGTATADITGGTPPYTYAWSPAPLLDNPMITGLGAGLYSLTVTDDHNCEVVIPFNITEPTELVVDNLFQENVDCNGGNGSVTVAAIGGTSPYTYVWNTTPPVNGPTLADIIAGPYTVTATDDNGCTADLEVTITEPEILELSIGAFTPPSCAESEDGSITVTATGGAQPYTYLWDVTPPETDPTIGGIGDGSYTVIVTDDNGCQESISFDLVAPAPIDISIEAVVDVLCKGESTGEITISISGGTPNYAIQWDDPANQTGLMATGLMAGTYVASITDDNGCVAEISVTITEPEFLFEASITASQDVLCFGEATGSATVTATGGSGSYSYQWDDANNQQTPTATGLAAGSYNVTVTDNNGCTTEIVLNIDILGPVEALALTLTPSVFGGFNLACANDSNATIDLDISGGTAAYSVFWNLPGGETSTDEDLIELGPGTYDVLVTDINGCEESASITLTAPEPITIDFVSTPSLCFGLPSGSLSITIFGGVPNYTVAWNGPNGFTSSDLDLVDIVGGIYNLIITDSNGCEYIDALTVVQPEDIIITVDSVSDYNGFNTSCWTSHDGEIYITPSGGNMPYTIQWNTPSSPNFSNQEDVTGLGQGVYEVVVIDDNGCVQNEFITLTAPDTIQVDFNTSLYPNGYNISCFGAADGSIEALPSGGNPDYTYLWIGPSGFGPVFDNPIEDLEPGQYSVLVTDSEGCFVVENIALSSPDEFEIELIPSLINGNNISCNGAADGSINLIIDGGENPIVITWTGPNGFTSTTEDLFDLEAGEYCVSVLDANDCLQEACITLTEPDVLDAVLTPLVYGNGFNLSCSDSQDGAITTVISGGTPAYTTSWTGPNNFTSTDVNLTGLSPGTYCLITTDINGCEDETCVDLTAAEPLEIIVDTNTPPSCNTNNDGSLEISVAGGEPIYTYAWTGPNGYTSTDEDIFGLELGTYCVEVTDGNNCTSEACFVLDAPAALDVAFTTSTFEGGFQIQCFGTATGSISAAAIGGIAPYNFAWTGPNGFTANTESIFDLVAGTYCVEITDDNGCTFQSCTDLNEPAELASNPIVTLPNCGDGTLATIDLNVSGGVAPYTFNWSNSADTEVVMVDQGNYTVIIADANGCETTEMINIILPTSIDVILQSPEFGGGYNLTCNGDNSGAINSTIFGGAGNLTGEWTGPNGFTSTDANLSNLESGTYCLTNTDDSGCTGTACITLTQPDPLSFIFNDTGVSCAGEFDGTLTVSVSGGVPTYDITWTGPNGFVGVGPSITGLEAGNYCATATDFNGCSEMSCFDVNEPLPINIVLTSPETNGVNIFCYGDNSGEINAIITGGTQPYTFAWIGPNGYSSSSLDLINIYAGEYCLTVTDENGCQETACITLTQSPGIDITIDIFEYANGFNTTCGDVCDGLLDVSLIGGAAPITVLWQGPNGFSSDLLNLTNLCAGAYTLLLTDADGCEQDTTIIINEPTPIEIDLDSPLFSGGIEVSCFGANTGTILTTIGGGIGTISFSWTGPNGFVSADQNLEDLFAGTYDLTVTDDNGCAQTSSITLNEPAEALTATATAFDFPSGNQISCLGANDGSITSIGFGGTAPYDFNWNGPNGFVSNQSDITDLAPGAYTLVVEDANDCVFTVLVTITEPATALSTLATVSEEILCANGANAAISVLATDGSPGYEIDWTGPNGFTSTEFNLTNLSEGTYTYIVSDINGCTSSGAYTFIAPLPINVSASITDAECQTATGIIDLTVSNGTPAYTYTWSNTETGQDLINVPAGDYNVIVEDANGCTFSETYTIATFSSLALTATITDLTCFNDSTGAINMVVDVGTEPIAYQWDGPGGFTGFDAPIENLASGDYILNATDLNGCTFSETYTVSQPDTLVINPLYSPFFDNDYNLSGFQSGDGVIESPDVNGGTLNYAFEWTSLEGYTSTASGNQLNLNADTYFLTVTDANGCTDTTSITLIEPIPFEIPNGISPNGDGFNDGLVVRGIDDYPINKFMVFNRWGNMVYEENNYSNATLWYGTNNDGEELPEGTYFVIVEVSGEANLKGYLELRR